MKRRFIVVIDEGDSGWTVPDQLWGWLDGLGFEETSGAEILMVKELVYDENGEIEVPSPS